MHMIRNNRNQSVLSLYLKSYFKRDKDTMKCLVKSLCVDINRILDFFINNNQFKRARYLTHIY